MLLEQAPCRKVKLLLSNTTVSGQISVSGASDFDYEGEVVFLLTWKLPTSVRGPLLLQISSFMFNEGIASRLQVTNGSVLRSPMDKGPAPVNMSLP